MCLAIPGRIIEINENEFKIEYPSKLDIANINLTDNLKIGDYVIVSNKIIIKIIPKIEAEKYLKLISVSTKNE